MTRFEIASAVVEAELAKPYAFGETDCFLLGCCVADAFDPSRGMTGMYRGTYATLFGAHRRLRKLGHRTLAELLGSHLERCAPAQARTGDVVVVSLPGRDHVGICFGQQFVMHTAAGRQSCRLGVVSAAFRT